VVDVLSLPGPKARAAVRSGACLRIDLAKLAGAAALGLIVLGGCATTHARKATPREITPTVAPYNGERVVEVVIDSGIIDLDKIHFTSGLIGRRGD
jgi:hypothetical protein